MTKEEQIYNQAQKKGACPLLKGTENTDELISLFFTPQGIEFCTKHNFPTMEILSRFKGAYAADRGIYVDTPVRLKNPARIALFGKKTIASIKYDDNTKRHEVIVMYGAKVKIEASGYAVVFVTNCGGDVEAIAKDNAVIL